VDKAVSSHTSADAIAAVTFSSRLLVAPTDAV
jgi:hypothetical protein